MYLTCNAEQWDFQTFALCIGTWSHSLCKWHISSKAKNVNNHQDGGSWLHPCSSLTCNVTWNVGNMCSHSSLGGGVTNYCELETQWQRLSSIISAKLGHDAKQNEVPSPPSLANVEMQHRHDSYRVRGTPTARWMRHSEQLQATTQQCFIKILSFVKVQELVVYLTYLSFLLSPLNIKFCPKLTTSLRPWAIKPD